MRAKDLGLIIVDEEQRFGVKQKELLRQLKLKVDVISMSATPIPRTLQMSLAGLRDITVIETPPEGRRPVKTYVGEYDEDLVKQALEREHAREGQAFFLHNRVDDIDETAERLRALCPQLRFTVAHGQMDEKQLEQRMIGFLRGDADVLVSTSIIESGIDIPQANTLIVDRADLFGLSQLYQIRGRVGRSRERAYAYLLYPSAAALTQEAADRLSALSDYTELGAGFKVAMRDLELRGAGALLGDEQSGHVAALGFELYMQMLDEAVGAMSEEGDEELPEPVRLDVNVDAYIPADYIPYEQAKVDVHRRIAGARDVGELEELRAELADRFGDLPEPLENLITLQQARIKLGEAGARAVTFRQGRLAVTPIELDSVRAKRIRAEIPGALYESGKSQLSVRVPDDPAQRFPAVVRAADVLLEVQRRPHELHGSFKPRPLPCGRDHETKADSLGARRLFCARRDHRRVWRCRTGQRGRRGRWHRHREVRLRALAERRREGERSRRDRSRPARYTNASRRPRRRPPSPPRASRSRPTPTTRSSARSSRSSCASRSSGC